MKGLEIKGRRKEIAEVIKRSPDAEEVILKTKPSKYIFLLLLNRTKMKKIVASKAVYESIGRKYWKALREMGIWIKIEKRKKGVKKYSEKFRRKILREIKKKGVSRVARKYGVGRRTIYYWMRN